MILPFVATIGAMASFQVGAASAKGLFPAVGPQGAATLRLGLAAVLLLVITRPWRIWPKGASVLPILALGISMAGAILFFYLALEHLPLGLAMALQFLGPLAVAVVGSRRVLDFSWVALAAAGVWLVLGVGPSASINLVGVLYALGAAVCWATYILCGQAASASFGKSTAALAVSIAAVLMLPVGVQHAGISLLSPALIPIAVAVALFSTAIPFSLDFYAMPRMPARTFAVLMSMEPIFGVLAGLILLNEALTPQQIVGVTLVVAAAAGAAWSSIR